MEAVYYAARANLRRLLQAHRSLIFCHQNVAHNRETDEIQDPSSQHVLAF
jgi:hypothetical protein